MAPPAAVNGELADRVSFASNTSATNAKDGDYTDLKSPAGDLENGGALREGEAPSLLSKESLGVLVQYAGVGLIDAVLPQTVYPFLQSYLNASGIIVLTATTLMQIPWSCKFFYGMLSDCVPIKGYRRRPYMVLGWTIAVLMLLVMGFTPIGKPYWGNPDDANLNPDKDPAEYAEALTHANDSAPGQAGKYVLLMMFCAFGYLMSDVCADGLVVALAQREPVAKRGRMQSAIYSTRTAFNMIGQLVVGFAFNGVEYGGDFSFSLSFSTLMLILAVVACPVIPMTWFFIKEEKAEPAVFKTYIGELWRLIQSRAVYQTIFYYFFSNMFAAVTYTASSPVKRYLIHVSPLNDSLANVLSSLAFMLGISVTGKYGLHWSWRRMIVITGIIVTVVDCVVAALAVWDVFRSQWFWLGLPMVVNLPYGISFLISTFVVVELAGMGNEAAMYGLMTTVSNLANPFAATATKIFDSAWDFSNERVMTDTHTVRKEITYSIGIMYLTNVISWCLVWFLPRQKEHTHELMRTGGSSKVIGIITVCYVLFAFIFSISTNVMSIFPATSCLVIAGGDGC